MIEENDFKTILGLESCQANLCLDSRSCSNQEKTREIEYDEESDKEQRKEWAIAQYGQCLRES